MLNFYGRKYPRNIQSRRNFDMLCGRDIIPHICVPPLKDPRFQFHLPLINTWHGEKECPSKTQKTKPKPNTEGSIVGPPKTRATASSLHPRQRRLRSVFKSALRGSGCPKGPPCVVLARKVDCDVG